MSEAPITNLLARSEDYLHQLEQQERNWRLVLEDYPGTEFARLAQDHLERLDVCKSAIQAGNNPDNPPR